MIRLFILLLFTTLVLESSFGTESELKCDEEEIRCLDGSRCYTSTYRCDGFRDCDDESDEINCTSSDTPVTCFEGEFTCIGDGQCVPNNYLCDGSNDCIDGSDEENCTVTCDLENEFKCASENRCINKMLVCDGKAHCHDSSDEHDCVSKCDAEHEMACHVNGTECIPISHKCDGYTDCSNDYDESEELCPIAEGECAKENGGCDHNCVVTHSGYHCSCHEGFQIGVDRKQCEDIDECSDSHQVMCSQLCTNTYGSYNCSCLEGYQLSSDDYSCVAENGIDPELWFTNNNSLIQYNMRSHGQNVSRLSGTVRAFDFDYKNNRIFWIDILTNSISWMSHNGSHVERLLTTLIHNPTALAYDWIHDNIYWTQLGTNSKDARIEVLTVATKWRHVLLSEPDVVSPTTLLVDPRSDQRFLYWGQSGGENVQGIYRCGLDGSGRRRIVDFDIEHPSGLALDIVGKRIIWLDSHKEILVSWHLRTNTREVLYTFTQYPRHPVGLAVFEGWMYWADATTKSVYKLSSTMELNHETEINDVLSNVSLPTNVRVYHQYLQPTDVNGCGSDNGGCSHICLPLSTFVRRRCVCPDNDRHHSYQLNTDGTCINTAVSSTTPSAKVLWSISKQVTQPAKSPAPVSNGVYNISKQVTQPAKSPAPISNGVLKPSSGAHLNYSQSENLHSEASGTPPGLWIAISIGIAVLIIGSLLTVMVLYKLYLKHTKHTMSFETGVFLNKDSTTDTALKSEQDPFSSPLATIELEETVAVA